MARAEITAHVARHVCASILRASGAEWDVIATQMGHSSGKVAEDIYVHPIEAEYVRLAREVSDYRAGLSEVERSRQMRSEGIESITDDWTVNAGPPPSSGYAGRSEHAGASGEAGSKPSSAGHVGRLTWGR